MKYIDTSNLDIGSSFKIYEYENKCCESIMLKLHKIENNIYHFNCSGYCINRNSGIMAHYFDFKFIWNNNDNTSYLMKNNIKTNEVYSKTKDMIYHLSNITNKYFLNIPKYTKI
jgi:beta-galactosidase beta subunit